jgi:nucleotide-binding universal stress UspA family protein
VARIVAGVDHSPGARRALAWAAQEPLEGVQVQPTVVADQHPAEALVDLSADAELLVVGSRGRGGFGELLLGSVSHAVVLHAVCPVVVVPSPRDEHQIRPPRH